MLKKSERKASVKVIPGTAKPIPLDTETALGFALGKKVGSSGKVPSGDVRLTANIKKELHTKLKVFVARERTTVGAIIEKWIRETIPG